MHALSIFGLVSFIFASVAPSPLSEKSYEHELPPSANLWSADLINLSGDDEHCGHSAILLVREEWRGLTILDAAGRRIIATVPVKDDGSASLEIYSATLHAYVDVAVPAGGGPRVVEVLKSHPVLCRYRLTPR